MELNKNIYNLRKAKGFSQEYMAEQIKISFILYSWTNVWYGMYKVLEIQT